MLINNFSKHIFWSYNPQADLPEEVIIKQVAIYGEISDLKKLAHLINKDKIKKTLETLKMKHEKRVNFILKVIL